MERRTPTLFSSSSFFIFDSTTLRFLPVLPVSTLKTAPSGAERSGAERSEAKHESSERRKIDH